MMSRRLGLSPDLRLGGASAPAAAPVMAVSGNAVEIANGDATPDAADHTQFAATEEGTTVSRTFTINVADAELTGINVLVPAGYTLVTPPDATIAAGGSDTFVVRCDAATPGTLSGNITIESTELTDYVFAVACVVANILVYDTFTDANNTTLTAHTPDINDVGASWQFAFGASIQIQSNRAVPNARGDVINTNDADVTVTANLTWITGATEAGVLFRYIDSTHYWYAFTNGSTWSLREANGGNTVRDTEAQTLTNAVTYVLRVATNGTSIEFYVDDVLKLSFTSSVNQAGTRHGLFGANAPQFDNFKVVA